MTFWSDSVRNLDRISFEMRIWFTRNLYRFFFLNSDEKFCLGFKRDSVRNPDRILFKILIGFCSNNPDLDPFKVQIRFRSELQPESESRLCCLLNLDWLPRYVHRILFEPHSARFSDWMPFIYLLFLCVQNIDCFLIEIQIGFPSKSGSDYIRHPNEIPFRIRSDSVANLNWVPFEIAFEVRTDPFEIWIEFLSKYELDS